MPKHDLIDNQTNKLADMVRTCLDSSACARFAIGYFFLSGFETIADRLDDIEQLYLLIGNTSTRETIEQMAEGYHSLETLADEAEAREYPPRAASRQIASDTATTIAAHIGHMEQSDGAERLLTGLARMIAEGRLTVRVYTKDRLHAKAYIFDYKQVYSALGDPVERPETGTAIVGSSNLTLAGLQSNTELNVMVQGNANHAALVEWFERLWNDALDFDELLMDELNQSWAGKQVTPYELYLKAAYELLGDRLTEAAGVGAEEGRVFEVLTQFQRRAVDVIVSMMREHGGAFVADVVGLGKSYIGAAVIKYLRNTEKKQALIICPASLKGMWDRYNAVYDLGADIVSMGELREEEDADGLLHYMPLEGERYADRDLVLVDESHNFRNIGTQRYRVLQHYLATGRRLCCFLTATPRNRTGWDIYNQIKLFHQDDVTQLPIDPPNLKSYFKLVERGERELPELLQHLLYRRRRRDILRFYGIDAETDRKVDPAQFADYESGKRKAYIMVGKRKQYFPERNLETIQYSIEDTYKGLYQRLRGYLGKPHDGLPEELMPDELTYARYGLGAYVRPEAHKSEPYRSLQTSGANLCGLMRIMLFKRFESSVEAFRRTLQRMLTGQKNFLTAIENGIIPAGDDARSILYESDIDNEISLLETLEALETVSGRYDAEAFDLELLTLHIKHDINLFERMLLIVEPISPKQDAKLQALKTRLKKAPLDTGKCLIFTEFADTAEYLYKHLSCDEFTRSTDVIFSNGKDKAQICRRFAPQANNDLGRDPENEIDVLIATDVLSEGLNLQDCDKIINYDLHWNPVRLIQRFGRIDRIGSEHEMVRGFNFLPETELEKNLGLRAKLQNRIREIHETIGEDAAVLEPSESLNEDAMYAIFEGNAQLELFGQTPQDEYASLTDVEEMLRTLRDETPEEYARILQIRDGVRTARLANTRGTFAFCRAGDYDQLYLVDAKGNIISRDPARALAAIRCEADEPMQKLAKDHNISLSKILHTFADVVRMREAEMQHVSRMSVGQRYIDEQLRLLFHDAEGANEERKAREIEVLQQAFSRDISEAVKRELNSLRRNEIHGEALRVKLIEIYHQHALANHSGNNHATAPAAPPIPRIVCSERLL